MTYLYVAPHLDDVALSCAGGLLARIATGQRVVVCTVFTRGGDATQAARRVREDAEALGRVGAEWVHLGFEDGLWREGLEPTFRSLTLGSPPRPAVVRDISQALTEVIRQLEPREVWLPLAIGGHVDHRAVFEARGAAGGLARFYEDRPYGFVPWLRVLRWLELHGGRLRSPPDAATIRRQFTEGACDALLASEGDTDTAALLAARLRESFPGVELRLRSRRVELEATALAAAASLMEGYASQVHWLFGAQPIGPLWSRLARSRPGRWFERELWPVRHHPRLR